MWILEAIIKLLMSLKHEQGYMPWDRSGNRLLVKSELGANKPTNYDIPQDDFVYGRITPDDPEHANQVMYQWKEHQPSGNPNHLKQKDLITTNKLALRDKVRDRDQEKLRHTSAHFSAFRKTYTHYKQVKEGSGVIPISLPESNHSYGKPLDLEDPIRLVMANTYLEDDRVARHTFYANQTQMTSAPSRKLSCHITKNHQLVKEATAKRLAKFDWGKQDPQWKLSKFHQVGYKVDTRRPRVESAK